MLARTRTALPRQLRLSARLNPTAMVTRAISWKAQAPAPLPNTKTFAGEAALPSLPVPDLDASLDRLKVTLRPLARSADELKTAESKIEELRNAGLGKKLQERLLQRKEEKDKIGSSWLEEWWDDVSPIYLDLTRCSRLTGRVPHIPRLGMSVYSFHFTSC